MILASRETIKEWTEKGAWKEETFIDYFKENVKKDSDKECLVDPLNKKDLVGLEPERFTYSQLDRAADATAEGFQKETRSGNVVMFR
jgi:non-ribosomal peptide synthetase component E (peptide arylation enzyme)